MASSSSSDYVDVNVVTIPSPSLSDDVDLAFQAPITNYAGSEESKSPNIVLSPVLSPVESVHSSDLKSSLLPLPNSNASSFSSNSSNRDIALSPPTARAKHRRSSSIPYPVKETLDARVLEDEDGTRRINQYLIKEVIGCGAFGTVELAIDTNTGIEYAMKEFSKCRLRKNSLSKIYRQGLRGRGRERGRGVPRGLALVSPDSPLDPDSKDPLLPIRSEIAILKKLNHENVVKLWEVLDDPSDDSLWMVFEMCKRGTIMNVSLETTAVPLSLNDCNKYFRQMVLGFEYLHENEIVHRDVKPDNLLLSADGTLKIVDFGVSEIFVKGDDKLKKSAGSPAFLAPELCTTQRGQVSGKATDIWSMGVTLYCLVHGHLPWEYPNIVELYDAICTKPYILHDGLPDSLIDLFSHLLDKNAETRITMSELRNHPWVTIDGTDPLISTEKNCLAVVIELTEDEIQLAVKRIASVMTVLKAATKLKRMSIGYRTRQLSHSRTMSSPNGP